LETYPLAISAEGDPGDLSPATLGSKAGIVAEPLWTAISANEEPIIVVTHDITEDPRRKEADFNTACDKVDAIRKIEAGVRSDLEKLKVSGLQAANEEAYANTVFAAEEAKRLLQEAGANAKVAAEAFGSLHNKKPGR